MSQNFQRIKFEGQDPQKGQFLAELVHDTSKATHGATQVNVEYEDGSIVRFQGFNPNWKEQLLLQPAEIPSLGYTSVTVLRPASSRGNITVYQSTEEDQRDQGLASDYQVPSPSPTGFQDMDDIQNRDFQINVNVQDQDQDQDWDQQGNQQEQDTLGLKEIKEIKNSSMYDQQQMENGDNSIQQDQKDQSQQSVSKCLKIQGDHNGPYKGVIIHNESEKKTQIYVRFRNSNQVVLYEGFLENWATDFESQIDPSGNALNLKAFPSLGFTSVKNKGEKASEVSEFLDDSNVSNESPVQKQITHSMLQGTYSDQNQNKIEDAFKVVILQQKVIQKWKFSLKQFGKAILSFISDILVDSQLGDSFSSELSFNRNDLQPPLILINQSPDVSPSNSQQKVIKSPIKSALKSPANSQQQANKSPKKQVKLKQSSSSFQSSSQKQLIDELSQIEGEPMTQQQLADLIGLFKTSVSYHLIQAVHKANIKKAGECFLQFAQDNVDQPLDDMLNQEGTEIDKVGDNPMDVFTKIIGQDVVKKSRYQKVKSAIKGLNQKFNRDDSEPSQVSDRSQLDARAFEFKPTQTKQQKADDLQNLGVFQLLVGNDVVQKSKYQKLKTKFNGFITKFNQTRNEDSEPSILSTVSNIDSRAFEFKPSITINKQKVSSSNQDLNLDLNQDQNEDIQENLQKTTPRSQKLLLAKLDTQELIETKKQLERLIKPQGSLELRETISQNERRLSQALSLSHRQFQSEENSRIGTDMTQKESHRNTSPQRQLIKVQDQFNLPFKGQNLKADFIGQVNQDGQIEGFGQLNIQDVAFFEGEFNKLGQRHGVGFYKDIVSSYNGDWLNDQKHGFGEEVLFVTQQNTQNQNQNNSAATGQAILVQEECIYKGEFKNNQKCGEGLLQFPDGSKYEGDFKDGKFEGKGTFYYKDGRIYQGQFQKGLKQGQGLLFFPTLENPNVNTVYRGQFKDDEISGEGYMKWHDGRFYQGNWKEGRMHGPGKLYTQEQHIYEGDFLKGKFNGEGSLRMNDGSVLEGQFKEGYLVSGQALYGDKRSYKGEFQRNKPHGQGEMTWPEGGVYEGHFERGRFGYQGGTLISAQGNQPIKVSQQEVLKYNEENPLEDSILSQKSEELLQTFNQSFVKTFGQQDNCNQNQNEDDQEEEPFDYSQRLCEKDSSLQSIKRTNPDGSLYEGFVLKSNQLEHGFGKLIGPGSEYYEGDWQNGKFEGYGYLLSSDMTQYQGRFVQGLKQGPGKLIFPNQVSFYEGDFQQDKYHGHGFLYFSESSFFKGQFQNNKMSGLGIRQYSNGDAYQGHFLDSQKHGKGSYFFNYNPNYSSQNQQKDPKSQGPKYEGHWVQDQQQGQGRIIYSDGSSYKGHWKQGKFDGHGIYRYADGRVYEGRWQEGHQHGQGFMTWPNAYYKGEWVLGLRAGQGEFVSQRGMSYKGEWRVDLPHGFGEGVFPDRSRYKGQWEYGVKAGLGNLELVNGDSYKGQFRKGKQEGFGKYDGVNVKYSGEFREGVPQGRIGYSKAIEVVGTDLGQGKFGQVRQMGY